MDLERKSIIQSFKMCLQKLLTVKNPLRVMWPNNLIIVMRETLRLKLQILSASQLLRPLTKVKLQWLMSPFQENTSHTVASFEWTILKRPKRQKLTLKRSNPAPNINSEIDPEEL